MPFSKGYAYDKKSPLKNSGATNPDSIQSNNRQYTFSCQFEDGSKLAPRGVSTEGVHVELVTEPTAEWYKL